MTIRTYASISTAIIITACASSSSPPPPPSSSPPVSTLRSGVDLKYFDTSVRPQNDLFRHVNGKWLEQTQIPADKSNYSEFARLDDEARQNIRAIVEETVSQEQDPGTDSQKIADLYNGFMDEELANSQGLKPLAEELKRIRGLKTKKDVSKALGRQQRIALSPLLALYVDQDAKSSTEYILYIHQAGLGMPDRDYYLKDDEKLEANRQAYVKYIETVLALAGRKDAPKAAKKLFDLEKALAEPQWTRVQNRDRDKTYNKQDKASLAKLAPAVEWPAFFEGMGTPAPAAIIVAQPSYVTAMSKLLAKMSVDDWKLYLEWNLLNGYAPYLGKDLVNAHFGFYGATISGIEQNEDRWKRAMRLLDETLGEALGRLYVQKHFKPEAKARMEKLVANLRLAFEQGINGLEWMSPDTKVAAQEKLTKFVPKIGYPDKWRDYSALDIREGDLVGNVMRAREFEHQRNLAKLGKPIDRTEWFMTPQTVNAYYNPPMNEIVFPAGILQPPFFDPDIEDAVNYGGIGAVIGHELSHGFDDQGRKSDGQGNLRDWWTEQDATEFKSRAQRLVDQYAAFEPLPGQKVNGELTLGENIGDLGGLTISYRAYLLSLEGKSSPTIDGLTGAQRFFVGWAQVWRRKYRDEELQRRLVTDPHSPAEFRVLGVVSNMPEFYEAFGLKEGDKLFRPADDRVKIW